MPAHGGNMEPGNKHGVIRIYVPNGNIADERNQLRRHPDLVRGGRVFTSWARDNAINIDASNFAIPPNQVAAKLASVEDAQQGN